MTITSEAFIFANANLEVTHDPLHRLAAAGGALLLVSVCGPALPVAHAEDPVPKVLLMLDASGSMKDFSLDGLELSQASIANATNSLAIASMASDVYTPDFTKMNSSDKKSTGYLVSDKTGAGHPESTINQAPEVQFRNRWDSPTMSDHKCLGFSMNGYYYYVLGLAPAKFLKGQPGKINFSIKVSGRDLR